MNLNSNKKLVLQKIILISLLISVLSSSLVVSYATPLSPSTIEYEIKFEIDYLPDHKPTNSALNYIIDYFDRENIRISFDIKEISFEALDEINISLEDIADGLNQDETDKIHAKFYDNADSEYSEWKWILYANKIEGKEQYLGLTYVRSVFGVNHYGEVIIIADEMCDEYADKTSNVEDVEVEAVVLMHEIGHSIGITKNDQNGNEVYDSDLSSVMAKVNQINCNSYIGSQPNWHYSSEYWALRYLEIYKIRLKFSYLPVNGLLKIRENMGSSHIQ